jgi:integrase
VIERAGKGRNTQARTFHSLRHSLTTDLANADIPAELRQKLTGHADETVHSLYTHTSLERLRQAVDKLPLVL